MQQNNRLNRLRAAREVVEELEDELGGQGEQHIQRMRSDLSTAGAKIRSAGYDRHMQDALGRAAGLAIGEGCDELADRATRVLDDDIEEPEGARETVEKQADGRGRVTLGSAYADQQLRLAVLAAEPGGED